VYFKHESAYIDEPCRIGDGTKIWHFTHIMRDAVIGDTCSFGQNCFVASNVQIGSNVKVQNNVSIYTGTVIEDDVFLGPSCVLTNICNPRSQINRHNLFENTVLKKGCTIGANATVVCGTVIGRYAFIAAGAVVTRDVPDYALIMGVPGVRKGWISRHGAPLSKPDHEGIMICSESGFRYREIKKDVLRCLDLDENQPLPGSHSTGKQSYRTLKES
jgi:UDP-2-acetamido-3-amino-2,3-dideoxy-glucuronate N-acetyltransferase